MPFDSRVHPFPGRARWLCGLAALLLLAPAASSHPRSTKPSVPVDVQLKVLDQTPGAPLRFETVVQAQRAVEISDMSVSFTGGANWAGGERRLAGKMDVGARRALPMTVNLPQKGHSEVFVRVNFTVNGMKLSRGAYLKFDDGKPWQPPQGRVSSWNGTPVLEYPAEGVKR